MVMMKSVNMIMLSNIKSYVAWALFMLQGENPLSRASSEAIESYP